MKKNHRILFVMALAAVGLLASCNKNNGDNNASFTGNGFRAAIEQTGEGNGSRTHINSDWANDASTDVLWTANDIINVNNGQETGSFQLTEGENTTSGIFSNGSSTYDLTTGTFYGAYPNTATVSNSGTATFTVPATQTYKANSFAEGAMPMVAYSTTQDLAFKNLFGGICFPIVCSQPMQVTSIVLTSAGATDYLNGTFTANCAGSATDNYGLQCTTGGSNSITLDCSGSTVTLGTNPTYFCIMVPPGTLANGFTVEAYNGSTKIFEKSNTATLGDSFISRSVIRKVNNNLEVEVPVLESRPLTLEAKVANSGVRFDLADMTPAIEIEYSTDGTSWNNYVSGTSIALVNVGDKVMFRGDNANLNSIDSENSHFRCTGECYVYGNVMSLLDKENYATVTTAPDYAFYNLFVNNGGIYNHPDHPIELTATTLGESCYYDMFASCTNLTAAPALPATTLAYSCYGEMFYGCTSLTSAPALPATTLAVECYQYMFGDCTNLTVTPELPATMLSRGCYSGMFSGCTGLTVAPAILPATTLKENCYSGMFNGCSSLTAAPALPSTTLASRCYFRMFYGCMSLTVAPELPATTLAYYCYGEMFYGCTSLTVAPELPATTLADNCYAKMFYGCTGLTAAPALPATTLADYCYYQMFSGCTNLNYVKCLATDISAHLSTSSWLYHVSSTGTFVKHPSMTSWPSGVSGIPNGWTVVDATL